MDLKLCYICQWRLTMQKFNNFADLANARMELADTRSDVTAAYDGAFLEQSLETETLPNDLQNLAFDDLSSQKLESVTLANVLQQYPMMGAETISLRLRPRVLRPFMTSGTTAGGTASLRIPPDHRENAATALVDAIPIASAPCTTTSSR